MNVSLSCQWRVTNICADSIRIGRVSSPALRAEATSDTKPFSFNLVNNLERPTTDKNITNITKSNLTNNQSSELNDKFCKKAALQTPNEGPRFAGAQSENKIKAETKDSIRPNRNTAENPALHQLQSVTVTNRKTEKNPIVSGLIDAGASAQESQMANVHQEADQRRGGFAEKINPPPHLLAKAKVKAGQQQKDVKTAANPAPIINNSCLNKLASILRSNAGELNAADKQQHVGCAPHTKKEMVGTRLGEGRGRSGTAHPTDKVVAVGSQKTTTASAGRLTAENPARPERTDTTAGSAGQKTAILNYSFHPVQGKSLNTEQKAAIGPEKSSVIAKKPVDSASLMKSTNPPLGQPGRSYCKTSSDPLNSNGAKPSDNPGLNVTPLQTCLTTAAISTSQKKDGGNSTDKSRFSTPASIESTAGGAPNIEFERSSIPTQNANIAKNALPKDISKDISEQIIESIHSSLRQADKQITIRLNPPELGQVFLRFQEREAEITGLLKVSKAEIRYEIEQALPQIIRTLADSGVQIKRLEVQLAEQLEPQADRNPAGDGRNDGTLPHYYFAEGGTTDENNVKEWPINVPKGSYQEYPHQQMILTNESINILI